MDVGPVSIDRVAKPALGVAAFDLAQGRVAPAEDEIDSTGPITLSTHKSGLRVLYPQLPFEPAHVVRRGATPELKLEPGRAAVVNEQQESAALFRVAPFPRPREETVAGAGTRVRRFLDPVEMRSGPQEERVPRPRGRGHEAPVQLVFGQHLEPAAGFD